MPGTLPLPPLVLASGSPRRRELLRSIGLDFEVVPAHVDETPGNGELPHDLVERLSRSKASEVARSQRGALVIAADTEVVVDGETLGKPVDEAHNLEFLERLSGRTHHVFTGHALTLNGLEVNRVVRTAVTFRELGRSEMERYVASGEGLDKAGGYAIQGLGSTLVPHIEGCYFNVVGLSLPAVVEMAAQLEITLV